MTKLLIENKAVAICGILRGLTLDEIAVILGAVVYGIISYTGIVERKAKAFAQLLENHINLAIETEYNPETPKTKKPCSKK